MADPGRNHHRSRSPGRAAEGAAAWPQIIVDLAGLEFIDSSGDGQ
jgi:hypothetical protein